MSTLTGSSPSLKLYVRLIKVIAPYRWVFLIGVMATIAASGVDAALAWLIKPIVNKGFIDRNTLFIHWLPLLVIVVFLVRGVASFLSNYCIARVGRSVVMGYRQRIFKKLLTLPSTYYDRISSGELLTALIYNVEQVSQACTDALITLLREGCLAIGLLVVMFVVSWRLALFFLVVAPLIGIIVQLTSRRMRQISSSVQEAVGRVGNIAEEAIEGYRVVRTFGGEQYENDKFVAATKLNRHRDMKVVVTNSLGTSVVQLMVSLPIAFALYWVTAHPHWISVGSFIAVIVAMLRLLQPLRRLTKINSVIQRGIAGAESIFSILDEPGETNEGVRSVTRVKGQIEFDHASFSYPSSDQPVLHDIHFSVQPGQMVALVGPSGAGKSTLISLLARFYEVTDGLIRIDGIDIRDYDLVNLRQQFAYVSQDVTLFNDTVRANIAYGMGEEVSFSEIQAVAEAAHATAFINRLADGFDTVVGEDGVLLSGGQRQRLAIARALLKNAPILILDEATSALDNQLERDVQAGFDALMKGRTTFVIAHRLSTIAQADLIFVMKDGQIVEEGSHDELLAQKAHYAELYNLVD